MALDEQIIQPAQILGMGKGGTGGGSYSPPVPISDVGGLQTALDSKQDAATGTPDGTKYFADNGSWKNLSASDMPHQPRLIATNSVQSIGSTSNVLLYGTPAVNECFTYSAGVWTCTVEGDYHCEFGTFVPGANIQPIIKKNGSYYAYGGTNPQFFRMASTITLEVGDTIEFCVYSEDAGGTNTDPTTYPWVCFLRVRRQA